MTPLNGGLSGELLRLLVVLFALACGRFCGPPLAAARVVHDEYEGCDDEDDDQSCQPVHLLSRPGDGGDQRNPNGAPRD